LLHADRRGGEGPLSVAGFLRRLLARLGWARAEGDRRRLGALGERHAAGFLRAAGYRILAKNLRGTHGEIDILCEAPDERTIVVVEVKTRRAGGRLPPEASVHARKLATLKALMRSVVASNGWQDRPRRIDVVAVDIPERGSPVIRHFVGVGA